MRANRRKDDDEDLPSALDAQAGHAPRGGCGRVAAAASFGAIAAFGSSAQTPPPKPLDQALLDAVKAPEPAGITARVRFTNNLFPSGALSGVSGSAGSALMSGGSGRLWWSPDGRGRIELQSDAGDAQILWNKSQLTVWDSSSNTVYTVSAAEPLERQRQPRSSRRHLPTSTAS